MHNVRDVLFAQCRAGFEEECARDLEALAEGTRVVVHTSFEPESGYALARHANGESLASLLSSSALESAPPVFARTIFVGSGPHELLSADRTMPIPDRITPLARASESLRDLAPFATLWIEYPDTNAGKALSGLARSLHARLAQRLHDQRLLDDKARGNRLHVFLASGALAWVGASDERTGSPWPMGIPRLRMPAGAPSRSTLKLAEAFEIFLGARAESVLKPGMHAVDLGAAPGGWTWQLARRDLRVTAVDNGALRGDVAIDPRVKHVRADGFTFRPRHPVDWLTCDIVDSPSRIARLVGTWIAEGNARHAIFNLKLPMKKRYDEVARCRAIILELCAERGVRCALQLRQLYHDREEVTGYLARTASDRHRSRR
ncbi:MAG TPA: 23S rRNA (cytidine(2498)-2'-O)-methyltransferase RlmM [Casimicrobiaceae bacterium]|nr:23S rRNA (cytidine(2498)-2'-O)-methyltransferase RlmM [Casimicrobiaceae bacterium]